MSALTALEARTQRDADVRARRNAEHACALDFTVYGDGDAPAFVLGHAVVPIPHAERCVFGSQNACSRVYDPMPYDEAEPADVGLYEGTAIGALYGLPGCEDVALELEGWTLASRGVE